jgi:hypothetical protein
MHNESPVLDADIDDQAVRAQHHTMRGGCPTPLIYPPQGNDGGASIRDPKPTESLEGRFRARSGRTRTSGIRHPIECQ